MLKAQLLILPTEKEKEKQVIWHCMISDSVKMCKQLKWDSTITNFCIVNTSFTTDSRSDNEDSNKESHIESTATNTTGKKKKRTTGNKIIMQCIMSESQ